ncbi:MAG: ABC transporter ATP-binding protein [Candidatus Pacebacteria bacterium]|nr:ABC transporter ATP-binding protein [Candidatus Paceibacterota bacterium]
MPKKKNKNIHHSKFHILKTYVAPFRKQLFFLSLVGLVSSIANGFLPYVTGRFFDALIAVATGAEKGIGLPLWVTFLGLWALVQIIATHADWIVDRYRGHLDLKLHMSAQVRGFQHLLLLPMSFHSSTHMNENLNVISRVGWRLEGIVNTFVTMVPQFLSVIIGITLAASINLLLAGVMAFGIFAYILILVWMLRPIAKQDDIAHREWSKNFEDAATLLFQIESVKQAASEQYEVERIRSSFLSDTYNLWKNLEDIWSNISYFQRIIIFGTQLTVFFLSVAMIEQGTISVGDLVALNGYSLMFFGPFIQFGSNWKNLQNGLTAISQAEELVYDKPIEIYEPKDAIETKITGRVEFKDVSYHYSDGKKGVLQGVNFHVTPGEVVALVGESGVGKSTTISLISGYYFPVQGEVLIDGVDTRHLNLHSLRSSIGVVPQEVALFNDTILNNIRYGVFTASKRSVIQAAKEAHIHEYIESLPKKYETIVGDRGVKLSVGQKQRVAIARAILRDPSILILDEPTSALDARTEQQIAESLQKLMAGRTTFIIAHRLSTVQAADRIYVFKGGTIIEEGSHLELLAKKGEYHHLHELQLGLKKESSTLTTPETALFG